MLNYFNITLIGQMHIENDLPCQDYSQIIEIKIKDKNYIVVGSSDGVGSCCYSQIAAKVATKKALEYLNNELDNESDFLTVLNKAFEYANDSVIELALANNHSPLEYDCTLTISIYNGRYLWFGHIGDDGIVALFDDGSYKLITTRHTGQHVHELMPLRFKDYWEFKAYEDTNIVSYVQMTDGILDYCVDSIDMNNRVYFPFLKPALLLNEADKDEFDKYRQGWQDFFINGMSPLHQDKKFTEVVSDDITFCLVINSELLNQIPEIEFDFDKWQQDTIDRQQAIDQKLYHEYYQHKKNQEKQNQPKPKDDNDIIRFSNKNKTVEKTDYQDIIEDLDSFVVHGVKSLNALYKVTKKVIKKAIQSDKNNDDKQ